MGPMDVSTTCSRLCAFNGGSRNKLAHGGGLVGSTHHRGTPLFLSFVTSHAILYLVSGLSVEYCYSFIHHYFLFPSGPPENLFGEPYLQHGRTPPF